MRIGIYRQGYKAETGVVEPFPTLDELVVACSELSDADPLAVLRGYREQAAA